MVEGTPLERVQVVNSGARVQIPPSPSVDNHRFQDDFFKKVTATSVAKMIFDK